MRRSSGDTASCVIHGDFYAGLARCPVCAAYHDAYETVKRDPGDGSLSQAIKTHAQACGLVAFVFDVHPDRVAEAVRDQPTHLGRPSLGTPGGNPDKERGSSPSG